MKMIKDHRFSSLRSAAVALAFTILPSLAHAATIHGATDADVLWVADQPSAVTAGDAEMRNTDRAFVPPFIVIAVGSAVRFPNDDSSYHSIYSDSKADPFDIGYYGNGPGKSVSFDNPGIVDVHCHIHASMHATIVVADGPYTQATNGNYRIDGVLPGKVTLHAWSATNGERTITVDVANAGSDITLDVRR